MTEVCREERELADRFQIYNRALQFAHHVVKVERTYGKRVNRTELSQLLDAACAVGSNLDAARAAQSKEDFHANVQLSLKQARESHRRLRLLHESQSLPAHRIEPLLQDAHEIIAILAAIAKKAHEPPAKRF